MSQKLWMRGTGLVLLVSHILLNTGDRGCIIQESETMNEVNMGCYMYNCITIICWSESMNGALGPTDPTSLYNGLIWSKTYETATI